MSGRRSALIVATSTYEHEKLREQQLPAAEADARELSRVLGDETIGGFTVDVVTNGTSSEVQVRIEDFLLGGRPGDLMLIHFSCHGIKTDFGELYFAARNTNPGRPESTAVSAEFVKRCMRASRAGGVVLLLDCCYGAAFSAGSVARAGSDVNIRDAFPDAGGRGYAVITASSEIEYAFEGGELVRGSASRPSVFTQALVDGLTSGDADGNRDGLVSVADLYEYLLTTVPARDPRQIPKQLGGTAGHYYLARTRQPHVMPPAPAAVTTPVQQARAAGIPGRNGEQKAGHQARQGATRPAAVVGAPQTGLLNLASRAEEALQQARDVTWRVMQALEEVERRSTLPHGIDRLAYADRLSALEHAAASLTGPIEQLQTETAALVLAIHDAETPLGLLTRQHELSLDRLSILTDELANLYSDLSHRVRECITQITACSKLINDYRPAVAALREVEDLVDEVRAIVNSIAGVF